MPLPPFRADGWLPEGHHKATWEEISERFGGDTITGKRFRVAHRFFAWCNDCREIGLSGLLIVNGSFISKEPEPGDVDCIFVYDEETANILRHDTEAQKLVDYANCKAQGIGDIFAFPRSLVEAHPTFCRLDGFDLNKKTGKPKGVVEVFLWLRIPRN